MRYVDYKNEILLRAITAISLSSIINRICIENDFNEEIVEKRIERLSDEIGAGLKPYLETLKIEENNLEDVSEAIICFCKPDIEKFNKEINGDLEYVSDLIESIMQKISKKIIENYKKEKK